MDLTHKGLFLNKKRSQIKPRECTNLVQRLSEEYTGLRLGPLDFRHLRATHFFHCVEKSALTAKEKARHLEKYAENVGQSLSTLKQNYVYYEENQLSVDSIKNANLANVLISAHESEFTDILSDL